MHAFPRMDCTFEQFCEWLASHFGKHDAEDDIIRKLQSLRQRGKITAYCAEFLALWNRLDSKPDESLKIKWFRQGLQQRVYDATLYDENNSDWTSFAHLQAAVLRADSRIHSHSSHSCETDTVRDDHRVVHGGAPRSTRSFSHRNFHGGRQGNVSSYGSSPHHDSASQGRGLTRSREENNDVQCFNCRDYGHKANVCPKPRRGEQTGAMSGHNPQGTGFSHRGGPSRPPLAPLLGKTSTR